MIFGQDRGELRRMYADAWRKRLEDIPLSPLEAQIADGAAKVEGDTSVIGKLASTLVVFDPRIEILPGTAAKPTGEDLNDYEVGPVNVSGE